MGRIFPILLIFLSLTSVHCNGGGASSKTSPANVGDSAVVPRYGYQIVNIFPHDPNAFTQGLVFLNGKLVESTGQEGRSSLRNVEVESGKILKKVDVPVQFFAEGIAVLNNKIYQLTWQHELGFIYDAQSFDKVGQFQYSGEGWGLTTDGKSLILSDGSNRLRFLDPDSFRVTKTIAVA
ncbi:MAG TPA: glutaminyl-peptide cyclotransferase, partial [Pyrinomonadaceae bacterium]|nr:glutaminyl-peptide cyclotransferase [Pyrinomonadaceae bacterium]